MRSTMPFACGDRANVCTPGSSGARLNCVGARARPRPGHVLGRSAGRCRGQWVRLSVSGLISMEVVAGVLLLANRAFTTMPVASSMGPAAARTAEHVVPTTGMAPSACVSSLPNILCRRTGVAAAWWRRGLFRPAPASMRLVWRQAHQSRCLVHSHVPRQQAVEHPKLLQLFSTRVGASDETIRVTAKLGSGAVYNYGPDLVIGLGAGLDSRVLCTLQMRIISTSPSPDGQSRWPLRQGPSAADSASVSLFPFRRRTERSGRLTSTTA